jgi:23S rRNA (guanosine2251-2'-O)-methyltransferase
LDEDHLCGVHSVRSALRAHPERMVTVWVAEERHDRVVGELLQALHDAGVSVRRVPRRRLDQLSGGVPHQGVVARCQAVPVRGERELAEFLLPLGGAAFLLVLDGVQDPHNLGACLRSADGAGAHAVVLPRDRSAPITGVVRRTACGAAESLPIFQVRNLARGLEALKQAGLWLVGAADDAQEAVFDVDLTGPLALVLGAEGSGLRRLTRESCDRLVRIPMLGSVESLNVSVATGVCLYEAMRQRSASR